MSISSEQNLPPASGPSGLCDLDQLLAQLDPVLLPDVYCFTFDPAPSQDLVATALMRLQEDEGTTLILPLEKATAKHLERGYVCKSITLKVPSSLEAVGMMAVVAEALKSAGLPCNAVAGYHHDHLFVPFDQAEAALDCLLALQRVWAAKKTA